MVIPNFITDLVKNGISVELRYNEEHSFFYYIEGFYKSGCINIILNGQTGHFEAHARYNETTEIDNISDLVLLNYDWWLRSRDRFDGWAQPDDKWKNLLIKHGYIKKVVHEAFEPV